VSALWQALHWNWMMSGFMQNWRPKYLTDP